MLQTLVIRELELANKVFDVCQTGETTQAELVSEQDAEAWIKELQALDFLNKPKVCVIHTTQTSCL